MNQKATDNQSGEMRRPVIPFVAFQSRFLRRTLIATLVTYLLVSSAAVSAGHPAWAGCYLLAGVWALVFFALTPLVMRAFLFSRRPFQGMCFTALKLAWMAVALFMTTRWNPEAGISVRLVGSALVAGVTTPLAVVGLRAWGWCLEENAKKRAADGKAAASVVQSTRGLESKS